MCDHIKCVCLCIYLYLGLYYIYVCVSSCIYNFMCLTYVYMYTPPPSHPSPFARKPFRPECPGFWAASAPRCQKTMGVLEGKRRGVEHRWAEPNFLCSIAMIQDWVVLGWTCTARSWMKSCFWKVNPNWAALKTSLYIFSKGLVITCLA